MAMAMAVEAAPPAAVGLVAVARAKGVVVAAARAVAGAKEVAVVVEAREAKVEGEMAAGTEAARVAAARVVAKVED